jgi:hypothetical protein
MKTLKYFFLLVDIGFIFYWTVTALHLIPAELLFKDYSDATMVQWNWSFLPLDIVASVTGLCCLWRWHKQHGLWRGLALLSLAFTTASGFQAISFWAIAGDFDPLWWVPNLFLLVYPWFFIPRFVRNGSANR